MNQETEALKRMLERERKARKASEKILEEKSLELFKTNEELKKLNNSLENRYSHIVEQANDIIYRGNEQGYCTFVNSVVGRILGFTPQELTGRHFTEIVHPIDKKGITSFYGEQFAQKIESTYCEFKVLTKKKEMKWLGQNVSLIIENDKVIGISAVARDITLQKQAEEEVRRNEEKYRSIIDNMELGLLEVDLEGKAVSSNSRFKKLTGFSEEDILGKNPSEILMDKASRELIEIKHQERKRGESSVYEVKGKKKDGELVWLMISGAPRYDKQGNIVGSIGIHMDITQQKRLLNQLKAAKALAEESSKAKETFLAHMSHEIRTPLNSVLGMTHLLQDTNPTDEQKDYLETIKYSSEILLNIISDILDISKIEAGEAEFHESTFDLKGLVHAQQKTFAFRMAEKGVDVLLNWDESITTKLIGDKMFINQILMNLLGNASKFTNEGLIRIVVKKVKETVDHTFIEFAVMDTGIGIEEKQLSNIFDSFKQADQNTGFTYGGTGLGLSIAKHLVALHGGEIAVKSKINEGTVFTISIPFKNSTEPIKSHSNGEKKKELPTKKLKGVKVLVAEDNLMNQKFLSKVLEKLEVEYTLCDNGEIALAAAKKEVYDLVLMDIQMPKMDGYQTALEIRKLNNQNKEAPIIALTASALVDERNKVLEVGMNEHLSKPFSPDQLKEVIELLLFNEVDSNQMFPLDDEYLHTFYGEDEGFKIEMFTLFLNNCGDEIKQLEEAIKQNEHQRVYQIAHKNKSSFLMVGLGDLETKLQEIEGLAREKNDNYKAVFAELMELLPLALVAVDNELNQLKEKA